MLSNPDRTPEQFHAVIKPLFKSVYKMSSQFLGDNVQERVDYLTTIKDAVSELIIEESTELLGVIDVGEYDPSNGDVGVSGNTSGN